MSRAVVCCIESGRPDALRKVVSRIPSCRALAVIMAANRSSVPPRCSPMAVATSLADLVMSASAAASAGMDWPGRKPILVGGLDAA